MNIAKALSPAANPWVICWLSSASRPASGIKKTIATKPTKRTTIEKMTSRSVKPLRDLICMILLARCSASCVAVLIALLCRDIRVVRPSAR